MITLSYTSARANLAETMRRVCEDHDPIIITRASAEPVVIISLSDYENLFVDNHSHSDIRTFKDKIKLDKTYNYKNLRDET